MNKKVRPIFSGTVVALVMAACLEPLVRAQGVATCVMGKDLYNRRQAGGGWQELMEWGWMEMFFFSLGLGVVVFFVAGVMIWDPFLGVKITEAANVAGHFEGFPLPMAHCLGWCHIMTPVFCSISMSPVDNYWSIYMYLLSQEGTWQHGNPLIPQNSMDCLPKANFMIRYPDFFAIQLFNLRSVFDIYIYIFFSISTNNYDKNIHPNTDYCTTHGTLPFQQRSHLLPA